MQNLKYIIGYWLFIQTVKSQTVASVPEQAAAPDNSFKCFCSSLETDETCQYDSNYGTTTQTCLPDQSTCFLESISSNNPRNARNVLYLAGCTQEALEMPDCFNLSNDVQDCTATCAESLCNSPNGINSNTNNTLGFDLAKYAAAVVSKGASDDTPSGATGSGAGTVGGQFGNNSLNVFLVTAFLFISANLF